MPSISYYLIRMVLKVKGIKKTFSKVPLDVQRLRKEDIHQPSGKLLAGSAATTFSVQQSTVTEISPPSSATDFLLLYCPGGAYVYGPTELNWRPLARLVKNTRTRAWVVDYPKAPEANIREIATNIDAVYAEARRRYSPANIMLLGDSVGGSLVISLVQRLIKAGETPPSHLIIISPVLDASMSNPEIAEIDKVDPILSRPGVLSAKRMCAAGMDLKDPLISPLYGSFQQFPATSLFIAENDIMRPDQELAGWEMQEEDVEFTVIEGKGMPHVWPLLPVMKEAKEALNQLEEIVLKTIQSKKQKV
ncbi:alpha/beta hydrolase fold domain-containing protein [Nafulsella turpanensis]|uniref:alpha/beta hydrolase fold domain-containing protein n=1 Tax=Nafulsella turpanensis TaxID=1265690 RepID=UPI000347C787|nr:alpha/beta hydrolase [Nafulsella turpanensis]